MYCMSFNISEHTVLKRRLYANFQSRGRRDLPSHTGHQRSYFPHEVVRKLRRDIAVIMRSVPHLEHKEKQNENCFVLKSGVSTVRTHCSTHVPTSYLRANTLLDHRRTRVAVAMSGLPSQHDQGQEKMLGPSHHRHLIQLFIRETYHPVHDTPAENQAATDI